MKLMKKYFFATLKILQIIFFENKIYFIGPNSKFLRKAEGAPEFVYTARHL